jgi:flagellar biosynthesis protein FliR
MPIGAPPTQPLQALAQQGWVLALVLARVLPLGLALASLTRGWVPPALALSLCLALSFALAPLAGAPPLVEGLLELALRGLRELAIGAGFALSLSLSLLASSWAVRLSQPRDTRFSQLAVAPLSQAYGLCALWLVLSLGGERAIVIGLAESFRDAPLDGAPLDARALAWGSAQLVADALLTAIGFALPLLVSVWLLELTLVLVARVASARDGPREHGAAIVRPMLTWAAVALLLVPIVSQAPSALRAAIAAARALTRALIR